MVIIMYDGGVLTCNEIEFCGDDIIVDGYRRLPIEDVQKIISE